MIKITKPQSVYQIHSHRRRIPLNPSTYVNELEYWLQNVLISICIAYTPNYNRVSCDEGTKEEHLTELTEMS